MNLEYLLSGFLIRNGKFQNEIYPARPEYGRVNQLLPVSCRQDNYTLKLLKAIEFGLEL